MDRQISIDDDSANMEDDSQDTAIDDSASDRVPTSQKNDSQGEQVIAKQETIDVFRLKLVVLLVLMVSAASIASAVFIYLSKAEQNQFEEEFLDQSHKVLEAIGSSLDKTFGLFDSVAVAFVSFARATNQKWPFVTMPDFALRMSKLLPLTDAVNINILPLVTSQNREAWEAYSLTNEHWINEGMAFQESWDGYHGPVVYNGTTNGVIHGDFGNLPYNVR